MKHQLDSTTKAGLRIGTEIGRYRIMSIVGSGGMGCVYKAHDQELDRVVALKILSTGADTDPTAIQRFVQEGRALAKLESKNIVSVYDIGHENSFAYIAMEYVNTPSLHTLIKKRLLSLFDVLRIVQDIAQGLDHAHQAGIVHRDLKPANILVGPERTKLIDFGIAKSLESSSNEADLVRTETGVLIGTLNYIAPELFTGAKASPRSDLYALGLLIYEMTTGRTAYVFDSRYEAMKAILKGDIKITDNEREYYPSSLWRLMEDLIQLDPGARPSNAAIVVERSREMIHGLETEKKITLIGNSYLGDEVLGILKLHNVDRYLWPTVFEKLHRDGTVDADTDRYVLEAVRSATNNPPFATKSGQTAHIPQIRALPGQSIELSRSPSPAATSTIVPEKTKAPQVSVGPDKNTNSRLRTTIGFLLLIASIATALTLKKRASETLARPPHAVAASQAPSVPSPPRQAKTHSDLPSVVNRTTRYLYTVAKPISFKVKTSCVDCIVDFSPSGSIQKIGDATFQFTPGALTEYQFKWKTTADNGTIEFQQLKSFDWSSVSKSDDDEIEIVD